MITPRDHKSQLWRVDTTREGEYLSPTAKHSLEIHVERVKIKKSDLVIGIRSWWGRYNPRLFLLMPSLSLKYLRSGKWLETMWKWVKVTFRLDELWPGNPPEVLRSREWTEGSSSLLGRFWQSQSHTTSQVHPGKSHKDGVKWADLKNLKHWLTGLFKRVFGASSTALRHLPESYLWKAGSLASGLDVQYWGSGNVPRLGWSKQGREEETVERL